jgi:hypothetical protein
VRADLDTLLIAVYCAACSLFPAPPEPKRRRGRPRLISDNELICLMVAQMLLGIDSERQFLPIAGWRLRHLFPQLPAQTTYNDRCRQLAPKLLAEIGLKVVTVEDTTAGKAQVARRRYEARAHQEEKLRQAEGDETYEGRQRFDVAATLARERRLSRYVYLAEKSA